jgi:hypothetical protein|nr:MAG TPA: hypothetical protein [Caudoviricetes sp.]
MLNKLSLESSLKSGIKEALLKQSDNALNGDEQEDPSAVIDRVAGELAKTIASSVDAFVRGGDVIVGPQNVSVTSTTPTTPAIVAPLQPSKII